MFPIEKIDDELIGKYKKLSNDIKNGNMSMRQFVKENNNSVNDIICYIKLKHNKLLYDISNETNIDVTTLSDYSCGRLKLDEQFIEKIISTYKLDVDEVNLLYELLNKEENEVNE